MGRSLVGLMAGSLGVLASALFSGIARIEARIDGQRADGRDRQHRLAATVAELARDQLAQHRQRTPVLVAARRLLAAHDVGE
jgi:hypothetical protein